MGFTGNTKYSVDDISIEDSVIQSLFNDACFAGYPQSVRRLNILPLILALSTILGSFVLGNLPSARCWIEFKRSTVPLGKSFYQQILKLI